MTRVLAEALLPGVPPNLVEAAFAKADGNEIASGKFYSFESSAALAANAFGYFLGQPEALPPLPGCGGCRWPATGVALEAVLRFPWSGGRHPNLDALVETGDALIGVESKRYEPFRSGKRLALSEAYWRPVWGKRMGRYEALRDRLRDNAAGFVRLDAAQLVKHALGLLTEAGKRGRLPLLFYLYAEPAAWADSRSIDPALHEAHRMEAARFAEQVEGDAVAFRYASYRELCDAWLASPEPAVRDHAAALAARFAI
jgi:hypothetical protein